MATSQSIVEFVTKVCQGTEHCPPKPDVFDAFIQEYDEHHDKEPPLTIDKISRPLTYIPNRKNIKAQLHWGQRKLLLSEIQFITMYASKAKYVIYAGAAPGMHTLFLSELFPNHKFILIDPVEFKVYHYYRGGGNQKDDSPPIPKEIPPCVDTNDTDHHIIPKNRTDRFGNYSKREKDTMMEAEKRYGHLVRQFSHHGDNIQQRTDSQLRKISEDIVGDSTAKIFILEEFYTNEHSKAFHKYLDGPSIFISDIRTTLFTDRPTDMDILINNAQQYVWVRELLPVAYCLKFRYPFYESSIDEIYESVVAKSFAEIFDKCPEIAFLEDYKNKRLIFLDGNFYLQAFPPKSSTETRLIGEIKDGHPLLIEHQPLSYYEDRLCFHNVVARSFILYKNPNSDRRIGFDQCYDCSLENKIWEAYVEYNPKYSVSELVKKTSSILPHSLFTENHGFFFRGNPKYLHILERYNEKCQRIYCRS